MREVISFHFTPEETKLRQVRNKPTEPCHSSDSRTHLLFCCMWVHSTTSQDSTKYHGCIPRRHWHVLKIRNILSVTITWVVFNPTIWQSYSILGGYSWVVFLPPWGRGLLPLHLPFLTTNSNTFLSYFFSLSITLSLWKRIIIYRHWQAIRPVLVLFHSILGY